MVNFDSVIRILEVSAPIIGGFSTVILAILYWLQHGKLSEQSDILNNQHKIAKFDHTPYLVGPFKLGYDHEENHITMELTNTGGGVARTVSLYQEFHIPDTEDVGIELKDINPGVSRKDVGFLEPNTVYPNESNVEFVSKLDNLEVKAVDHNKNPPEEIESDVATILEALGEYGVELINIRYRITYFDAFGNSEDPFGRKYTVQSPTTAFNPQLQSFEFYLNLMTLSGGISW